MEPCVSQSWRLEGRERHSHRSALKAWGYAMKLDLETGSVAPIPKSRSLTLDMEILRLPELAPEGTGAPLSPLSAESLGLRYGFDFEMESVAPAPISRS